MDRPLSEKYRSNLRNKKWRQSGIAIIVLMAALYAIKTVLAPSVNKTDLRTATVSLGTIKSTISAGGLVVPKNEETLSSEFDTQVLQVLAQPGQSVEKGAPLLRLDTQSMQLALNNLQENISLKDNQIESRQLNLNKTLNDLQSRIALLQVDLESRQARVDRFTRLSSIGATSAQDLLEAKLNIKRTNIELQQLKQAMRDHRSTTLTEVAGLRLEKSILEKELEQQQRLVDMATLTAPRSGVLTWLHQETGAHVSKGQALARIADLSTFRIEATLSDFYASQLRPGMLAEVSYRDQVLSGQLETLIPTIENGLMKLIVTLDQPGHELLRSNLRVDVGLITHVENDVKTLAKGPYVNGRGVKEVFVIQDKVARKTRISLGASDTQVYQVLEGLKQGDEVIISDVSSYQHLNEFTIH